MKIKYVIVDDDEYARQLLKTFLEKYCPDTVYLGEAENIKKAAVLIKEVKPDLIFLDISMPHGSGFDLLNTFNPTPFEVIFVTAHDEHVLDAMRKGATDYLLKPLDIAELTHAVDRVAGRLRERASGPAAGVPVTKVALPIKNGLVYVKTADIIRLEADTGYTWVHVSGQQKFLVNKTLKDFEALFAGGHFIRVHHQHLINTEHVSRYIHGRGGQVVMTDDSSIAVSQRKRDELLEALGGRQ
ncbi:MAG: LytTR family DNA-binding domain-containing protein [Chitinophagales bacterium]